MTRLFSFAIAACAVLTFAACSPSALQDTQSDIFRVDEIPHAQLPGNVVPQGYRVDMIIDPDAEAMSGTVEIDVKIEKPTTKIWLHGKHMAVSRAEIVYAGGNAY